MLAVNSGAAQMARRSARRQGTSCSRRCVPWGVAVPVVKEYQQALAKYAPATPPRSRGSRATSGEGAGRRPARRGRDLTRAGIQRAMESLGTIDVGGMQVRYRPGGARRLDVRRHGDRRVGRAVLAVGADPRVSAPALRSSAPGVVRRHADGRPRRRRGERRLGLVADVERDRGDRLVAGAQPRRRELHPPARQVLIGAMPTKGRSCRAERRARPSMPRARPTWRSRRPRATRSPRREACRGSGAPRRRTSSRSRARAARAPRAALPRLGDGLAQHAADPVAGTSAARVDQRVEGLEVAADEAAHDDGVRLVPRKGRTGLDQGAAVGNGTGFDRRGRWTQATVIGERMPGALDITCASPRGNITMSPVARAAGRRGRPSAIMWSEHVLGARQDRVGDRSRGGASATHRRDSDVEVGAARGEGIGRARTRRHGGEDVGRSVRSRGRSINCVRKDGRAIKSRRRPAGRQASRAPSVSFARATSPRGDPPNEHDSRIHDHECRNDTATAPGTRGGRAASPAPAVDLAAIKARRQHLGERRLRGRRHHAADRRRDARRGRRRARRRARARRRRRQRQRHLAAARRFAQVTSTDYVPALLDKGRDRALAERLDVTFRVADAEALPFDDASFDVALSTFGVMFAPDHRARRASSRASCGPAGASGSRAGRRKASSATCSRSSAAARRRRRRRRCAGRRAAPGRAVRPARGAHRREAPRLPVPLPLGRALRRRVPGAVRADAQGVPRARRGRAGGARDGPRRAARAHNVAGSRRSSCPGSTSRRWSRSRDRRPRARLARRSALSACTASRTSCAWPGTFTPRHSRTSLPSAPIRNVERSIPRTCLPYMFFILMTPNAWHSFSSASEMSANGKPIFAAKPWCDLIESREMPATTAPAFANRSWRSRKFAPSVVQPGVLSFG